LSKHRNHPHRSGFDCHAGTNFKMKRTVHLRVSVALVLTGMLGGWIWGELPLMAANEPPPLLITREGLQSIVDRNPFGLKPPPPQPTNEPPAAPEAKLNINITGITRTKKGKRVHLVVQPEGKGNPTSKYLSIAEGDRQDGIKVLEINDKSDKVKIQSAGVESVLSFATHGLKATAPPPAATKSGVLPPGMLPQPGQINTPPVASGPRIISRGGVTRTGEVPNANPPATAASSFGIGGSTASTGLGNSRAIPSRSLRTQPLGAEDGAPIGNEKAALQVIQMEAQKISNPHIEFPPTPAAPGLPPIPQ